MLATAADGAQVRDAAAAWVDLYNLLKYAPAEANLEHPPEELSELAAYVKAVGAAGPHDLRKQERLTLKLARTLGQSFRQSDSASAYILAGLRKRFYAEAVTVTTALRDSIDPTSRETVNMAWNFRRLYFGPMAIVEGEKVGSAMVEFRNALGGDKWDELQSLAEKLAVACRDELAEASAGHP
jgi:hypothetical protein